MDADWILAVAGFAKRLLEAMLLPPAGPLVLAIVGFSLTGPRRGGRTVGPALLGIGLVSAWLLSTPFVAGAITYWLERDAQPALGIDDLRRAVAGPRPPGAIVVISGGMRHNPDERPDADTPNWRTLERLAHGAELARASGLPLLLSGGVPRERETSEAVAMQRVLERSFGMRARWVEDRSPTTAGNAREVAKILRTAGIRRIVLVTNAYHMRRARATFEAAGLSVLAAPHGFSGSLDVQSAFDFVPNAGAVMLTWQSTHELVGWWYYRLVGSL